jgi:hypothetical protein
MKRITEKQLQSIVDRLNEKTGIVHPNMCSVGTYMLSFAYGGVSLHRIMNTSGGVDDVLSCGHIPKRDLYNRMQSYLLGMVK